MPPDKFPIVTRPGPVVMVDDDEVEFFLLKKYMKLAELDRDIILFSGGNEFLSYMNGIENDASSYPAVVFLDVRMPGTDGFSVLKQLRSNDHFTENPLIIVFSNSQDSRDVEKAMSLKANGYSAKPIDKEGYLSFLRTLFPLSADGPSI